MEKTYGISNEKGLNIFIPKEMHWSDLELFYKGEIVQVIVSEESIPQRPELPNFNNFIASGTD